MSDDIERASRQSASATGEGHLDTVWQRFNAKYPTEAHCLEELYRRAAEAGLLRCRGCGSDRLERAYGFRVGRCKSCGREAWLTAGTFFHRIRKARPWLAAIWLMEHGVSLSSSRFHTLVEIAYSSALNIFRKLAMVLDGCLGDAAPSVRSSHFSVLICKRSRETPSRAHPTSEENEIGCDPPAEVGAGESTDETELSEQERSVLNELSSEPINFGDLASRLHATAGELSAALTMLELAGVATRMPGDRYARSVALKREMDVGVAAQDVSLATELVAITSVVAGITDFVRECFHGISRKYLQLYLAVHWCKNDRSRWCRGSLLQSCLRSGYISSSRTRAYVTPALVRVFRS